LRSRAGRSQALPALALAETASIGSAVVFTAGVSLESLQMAAVFTREMRGAAENQRSRN
jgi:hypothetical protein